MSPSALSCAMVENIRRYSSSLVGRSSGGPTTESEFFSAPSRIPALNCSDIFPRVVRIASDVAAWPCEARDNVIAQWIGEDPDDWNRAGGRLKIEHKAFGVDSDNQIWILTDYLTNEV